MALSQLVYVSRATYRLSRMEISGLAKSSASRNAKCGLTGLLLCSGGQFLQLLEGDPASVAERFSRIEKDERHTDVLKLMFARCETRLFGDWNMGLLNLDEGPERHQVMFATTVTHLRAEGKSSAEIALALLKQFSQQLPIAA
jgi:hypothetical protein